MTPFVSFKIQRTTGAAILLSVAMHAIVLASFVQYSMRPNMGKPNPATQNTYLPIEVMLLTAPMTGVEVPLAKSSTNQQSPPSAEQKPLLHAAHTSAQASKPIPNSDLHPDSKPFGGIARDSGFDSSSVDTLNTSSKSTVGAGDSSLNDGHFAQASARSVERRPDPEPAQGARPDYAYNPQPDYPMLLREQGIGGVVWLHVLVDSEGRPGEIKLAKGSGYRLLDDAALRAVRQWRFIPAKNGNQKLASWVEFPIRFTLNG